MKRTLKARLGSLLLAFAMVLSLLPALQSEAHAEDKVSAILSYANGAIGKTASDFGFSGPWDSDFIGYCAIKAGLGDLFGVQKATDSGFFPAHFLNTKKGYVYFFRETTGPKYYFLDYIRQCGIRQDNLYEVDRPYTPQPGDLIYLREQNTTEDIVFSKVGIVRNTSDQRVYYFAGNYDMGGPETQVVMGAIPLDDKEIVAYVRPTYSLAETVKPQPKPEPSKVTVSWEPSSRLSVGTTNATLAAILRVKGTSINNVSQVGVQLYSASGKLLKQKTERPIPKNGVIDMWYDVNKELGYTLSPGTKYQFCFTAVVNGQSCKSKMSSLTTGSKTTVTVTWDKNSRSSVGKTNATLAAILRVKGTSINNVSQVGVELYNASGSLLKQKKEKPIPKNGVIDMWYDVNKELGYTLSPGTKYQFRFTAVVGGKACHSNMYSLTTAGGTAPHAHHGVRVNGQAATCTTDGWKDYYRCSSCGKLFSDSGCTHEISLDAWKAGSGKLHDANAHSWGSPTYTWSRDGKSCTAQRVCRNNASHKETARASVSSSVTKKPTETSMGETTYTASFSSGWAAAQRKTIADIPALSPLEPEVPPVPSSGFADVKPGDYFYDAVEWAVANNVTSGTGAGRFSPNMNCSRAQAVTFLWRAAGCPSPRNSALPFTDVPGSSYFADAVRWAVEQNITGGTGNGKFSPNMTCSRGQIVTFLWRWKGMPQVYDSVPFNDVHSGDYFAEPVRWAVASQITNGTSATRFSPNMNCSRGQIVTFLYRAQ